MLDLVRKRPSHRICEFPKMIDLQEMLALPKIQACTHLWVDSTGLLVGFAILDSDQASAFLIFEISPDWEARQLESQMLNWAETCIRETRSPQGDVFTLETGVLSDNADRMSALEQVGFKRQTGGSVHMERSLSDPIDRPLLPDGFVIRPIRGEQEAGDWVRLHRAALGTETMTAEYKLAMMRTPGYDPHLDLLVVGPDGGLAAYCVCYINEDENYLAGQKNAYTDPIATHPDFQRRGLSKALLLTGMVLLKERGIHTARLGTSSLNNAMILTAQSVGFHITKTGFWYNKPIRSGYDRKV